MMKYPAALLIAVSAAKATCPEGSYCMESSGVCHGTTIKCGSSPTPAPTEESTPAPGGKTPPSGKKTNCDSIPGSWCREDKGMCHGVDLCGQPVPCTGAVPKCDPSHHVKPNLFFSEKNQNYPEFSSKLSYFDCPRHTFLLIPKT